MASALLLVGFALVALVLANCWCRDAGLGRSASSKHGDWLSFREMGQSLFQPGLGKVKPGLICMPP
jgi:hypothetical protein